MADTTRNMNTGWPKSRAIESMFKAAGDLVDSIKKDTTVLNERAPNLDVLTREERREVLMEMYTICSRFMEDLNSLNKTITLSDAELEELDKFDKSVTKKIEEFTGKRFTTWQKFDQGTDLSILKEIIEGSRFTNEERRYIKVQITWVEAQLSMAECTKELVPDNPKFLKRR